MGDPGPAGYGPSVVRKTMRSRLDMVTPGAPPITARMWAKVLVFGGVTAAGLLILLGAVLPFLVLDPPQGFGFHPFLEHNPCCSPDQDTYGRIAAGLFAWLGGTYVGIRAAGVRGRRERLLSGLLLAAVVAVLFLVYGLLADDARAREAEPPPWLNPPAMVSERTPLPSCRYDGLHPPNGEPILVANHQCLLDAFVAGETAEFVLYDSTGGGEEVEQIIRVLADATIEVFVHIGEDDTVRWERYTCASLRPASAPQIFELVGCDQPVPVPGQS